MAGYRSAFIKTTHLLSSVLPMEMLLKLTGQRLVVPVYHLVFDQTPPHIKHLYRAKNVKQFEEDLDFLLKHYKPIDMEGLLDIVRNGKQAKDNSFIVTFDDGLREFYDIAAPVLLAKGIPAINFLNRDFVDNKGLFFRYKASLLIDCIKKDKSLLQKKEVRQWMIDNAGGPDTYQQVLLSLRYALSHRLDQLAGMVGLDFNAYLASGKPYMDSAQINELIKKGFYFGAHSCSHPEYRYISLDEQLDETRRSLKEISSMFDLPYRTFAFPFTDFGVGKEFFAQLAMEKPSVDITFGSAGLKNDPVPFHLQRIPLEMAGIGASEILKSEYLYYLLKQVFGKNTVQRS